MGASQEAWTPPDERDFGGWLSLGPETRPGGIVQSDPEIWF